MLGHCHVVTSVLLPPIVYYQQQREDGWSTALFSLLCLPGSCDVYQEHTATCGGSLRDLSSGDNPHANAAPLISQAQPQPSSAM